MSRVSGLLRRTAPSEIRDLARNLLPMGLPAAGLAESTDRSFVPNRAKLATPLSTVTLMYPEAMSCPTRPSKYCFTSFETRPFAPIASPLVRPVSHDIY